MDPDSSSNLTSVYFWERGNEGKHFLIEVAQLGSITTARTIVQALLEDQRCGSICLLVNNSARETFAREIAEGKLPFVENNAKPGIIEDIPGPVDVALAFGGPANTPAALVLYSAKSIFGSKKLIYFCNGGVPTGDVIPNEENHPRVDDIDAVLVEDELIARFYRAHMPWLEPNRIVVTGSSMLDSIRGEDRKSLRESGRKNTAARGVTILYSGFPEVDFKQYGGIDKLSLSELQETIAGVREAAEAMPKQDYTLIVRTHPRMLALEREEIQKACEQPTPPNFLVCFNPTATYEECVCASDIIVCVPGSNLTTFSAYRGQRVLSMAYGGKGRTGGIFQSLFTPDDEKIITSIPGVQIVKSAADVAVQVSKKETINPVPFPGGDSTANILNQLF